MNEEGEFKRRVRGQIEKQKQESKYPESLENNYIHELYISSFIDEATREFPMSDWEIKAWLSRDNLMEYIMSDEAEEIAKWALKWLPRDQMNREETPPT